MYGVITCTVFSDEKYFENTFNTFLKSYLAHMSFPTAMIMDVLSSALKLNATNIQTHKVRPEQFVPDQYTSTYLFYPSYPV